MTLLANLSREERIGLLIAGTAHVALAVVLMLQEGSREPIQPPQRITVSLADEVALENASPDPSADPAAASGPVLAPVPEPDVLQPPPPSARPTVRPSPRPTRTARPSPTPTQRARPSPTPSQRARPSPTPSSSRSPRSAPSPTQSAGASRVTAESMRGLTDANGESGTAGDRPSPIQQASILSAIIRQLRPNWNPPSGVDAERLVTVVRFRLNRDGTLNGSPTAVGQTRGITDSNRAQAARHREQAIRAVRLSAPFELPERFYSGWREVEMEFNQELAR